MSDVKKPAKAASITAEQLSQMTIGQIAYFVRKGWPRPYFGAVPYIDAMLSLETLTDMYGLDDGRDIVLRFLANAQQYRGPDARLVKAELNARLNARKRAASAG